MSPWKNLEHLSRDLRVDKEILLGSDKAQLTLLVHHYPSFRVQKSLKVFLKEMK